MELQMTVEKDSESEEIEDGNVPQILYSIDDVPPWYLCILLGFQHFLMMVGSTLAMPLILSPFLCIEVGQETNEVAKAELFGTITLVSGLATLLQTTFGSRLPIIQGGSASFLPPAFAILNRFGKCPIVLPAGANITEHMQLNANTTDMVVINSSPEHDEIWKTRMRALQGAIMVGAIFEVVLGFSGLMGLLLRYIGPLVIVPTISLIGLSLVPVVAGSCSSQWGIAMLTVALVTIFSQYMSKITIRKCSKNGQSGTGYPIFRLFPVILAILVVYIISIILTYTDVFPDDRDHAFYRARTDARISVLTNAKWFRVPYPGQWGLPTVTFAGVFGMMAGSIASMIESVGDYYAAARLAGAPPPTTAAINRGIGMEGIGCIIAGAWGSGNGTTSYSDNIGAIGITQVGSRRVIQFAAAIMIVLSILGKFCAVFVTIPDPILGGMYVVTFGMVTAVGMSNLQHVDLNSSRNLFILGTSLLLGLAVPQWTANNESQIETGSEIIDDLLRVLLSTSMFIGGGTAFFLDNTIPGTLEERGILVWSKQITPSTESPSDTRVSTYDLPFGNDMIYRSKWTSYIPVCPNFLHHRTKKNETD